MHRRRPGHRLDLGTRGLRVLVLGGTVFLGRHLVEAALAGGHEVTLFNRGRSDPGAFPEVEQVRGDRAAGLGALGGRSWDWVVDTSGYLPRLVRQSVTAGLGRYCFFSSVSVYEGQGTLEDSPRRSLADPASEDVEKEYPGLKAACEDLLPADSLVIRPGLIVGPDDPTERFTYWPLRIHRGGEVLGPGDPERECQFIDVRDLAAFSLSLMQEGTAGSFNAVNEGVPMGELLAGGEVTWVADDFLLEHEVTPYTEMPLWIPPEWGHWVDTRRARAAGLSLRPWRQSWQATLQWALSRSGPPPTQDSGGRLRPPAETLSADREAELLRLWHARA